MVWSARLTAWCQAGFIPKIRTSIRCEIQVSGCQFPPWVVVNAHVSLSMAEPTVSEGFAVRYRSSS